MIEIKLRNVVCSGYLGHPIPLDAAAALSGAEHDPKSFPGVRFRMSGCTGMLFATGKAVVVGAATEEKAYAGMDRLVGMLTKNGISVGEVTRGICNVVATAKLGRGIYLGRVAMTIPRSMFEPEHFPGVILRRQNPKCTILLFASGSMVCVGATSEKAASDAVNRMDADLMEAGL